MNANSKWLLGGLLLALALFLSSTFGTWMATCTLILLAAFVVSARGSSDPIPLPSRSASLPRWLKWALINLAVLIAIGVTAAWRIGDHLGDSINPIYVATDIVAHSAFVLLLLVWSLRPRWGHVSMLPLGLIVVLLCVAAGGTSKSLAAQTTVAMAACTGFVMAAQIILGHITLASGKVLSVREPSQSSQTRVATLFSLLTLSLILMATSALAKATSDLLPIVQNSLHEQLKTTFDATEAINIGGTRYVRGSTLGSIRTHMLADPQEVALRVYANTSPGYLRGSAFDLYQRQRWYAGINANLPADFRTASIGDRLVAPERKGSVQLEGQVRNTLSRFSLERSADEQIATLEIHNDPLKGTIVFMPLASRWIEAASGELMISHHGIVRTGVDVTHPYVVGVASLPSAEVLSAERRRLLLEVPRWPGDTPGRIVNQICRSESTAQEKAQAIVDYFRKDYSYSLTVTRPPARIDPIIHFLETKHPAHCEYFATATVLLLRRVGVPARYVTGYVAAEYSDENLYWLARNRDAHAWAEAYDDVSGRWFPVESTPGRTYQTIHPLSDDQGVNGGGAASGGDRDSENDTWLGRFWGWLRSMRATDPLMVVFRFAQLPLFCILVYLLWTRFGASSSGDVNPSDVQSRRMLRQVDRISRKRKLIRQPHETLHRFAERIEQHQRETAKPSDSRLTELAQWYRHYADARYRGEMPVPFRT